MDRYSPTVRRRALGIELRRLREAAGLTGEQAADEIGVTQGQISRMETAHRTVNKSQLRALLAVYKATNQQTTRLLEVHAQLRKPAWWHGLGVLEGTYVDLEAEATEIRSWDLGVISGLLQTEAYADATIRAMAPHVDADERKRRVSVRLQRTELLDSGLKLWTIMDEAAVRRIVGGNDVHRAQLTYLVDRCEALPNVTMQILPFDAGEHIGQDGSFALLSYDNHPPLGYTEQFGRGGWLEKEPEVAAAREQWERLLSTAEKPRRSIALLRDIRDGL